jgi:histidyl-tRNA synthetase
VKIEIPRGMRDILWEESRYIEQMKQKFIDAAQRFNFTYMEPSPLEMLSTLEAKSGTSISNETYSFIDKGGRKVGLRFDLTVGLTRFVCQRRDLRMPSKLSSYGGVWRYDEPQAGRYRYFHQWDIEIFGSFSNEADAEIIEFVATFLEKLGLNVVIDISHRKIIESYLIKNLCVTEVSTISEMLRAVDKLSRKTPQQVSDEYRGKLDLQKLQELINFSGFKGKPEDCPVNNILDKFEGWKHTLDVLDSLKSRNVKNVQLNFGIVRGLDYYSGLVFEASDTSIKSAALVGGGRYDTLPAGFGRRDIGATGAAGGVERILAAMENHKLLNYEYNPLIYVAYSSEEVKNAAIQVVSNLRKNGYIADYGFEVKPSKKQINEGIARKAARIILIEPEEIRKQLVTVRNTKGEETKVKIANLMEKMIEIY